MKCRLLLLTIVLLVGTFAISSASADPIFKNVRDTAAWTQWAVRHPGQASNVKDWGEECIVVCVPMPGRPR